jgi:hypothetical protein
MCHASYSIYGWWWEGGRGGSGKRTHDVEEMKGKREVCGTNERRGCVG